MESLTGIALLLVVVNNFTVRVKNLSLLFRKNRIHNALFSLATKELKLKTEKKTLQSDKLFDIYLMKVKGWEYTVTHLRRLTTRLVIPLTYVIYLHMQDVCIYTLIYLYSSFTMSISIHKYLLIHSATIFKKDSHSCNRFYLSRT